ncbi:inositol-tetrakisphosphate 1-kinase-like [Clytia hemisphaerica]|uniref:Inositol-tetrakisphosphate 1-kinase n=1 Tax=Clytia hemisphaerica TaxID=252671 RepID=A0A7M5UJG0_9CNID
MSAIRLGLCIPERKKSAICLPERIEALCDEKNIKIIEIDIDADLESQGPFDVLLHKIIDYYNVFPIQEADEKVKRLVSYATRHSKMVVLDDFDWCLRLTKRKSMIEVFEHCQFIMDDIKVFFPKTVELTAEMSSSDIERVIRNTDIRLPVVAKPFNAALDDGSHNMALVFSEERLIDLKRPCLIQEFCNHSGVYYKVFVVGDRFNICENPSIRDFHQKDSDCPTIFFNTRTIAKVGQPFNSNLHDKDPNDHDWLSCDQQPNMLNRNLIKDIIQRMRQKTGIQLFKFDLIVERDTGHYGLIDMNQFPSFRGIDSKHFPKHLVELITNYQ